eukprot:scaffold155250_cov42-Attheya_sp.AAC.1
MSRIIIRRRRRRGLFFGSPARPLLGSHGWCRGLNCCCRRSRSDRSRRSSESRFGWIQDQKGIGQDGPFVLRKDRLGDEVACRFHGSHNVISINVKRGMEEGQGGSGFVREMDQLFQGHESGPERGANHGTVGTDQSASHDTAGRNPSGTGCGGVIGIATAFQLGPIRQQGRRQHATRGQQHTTRLNTTTGTTTGIGICIGIGTGMSLACRGFVHPCLAIAFHPHGRSRSRSRSRSRIRSRRSIIVVVHPCADRYGAAVQNALERRRTSRLGFRQSPELGHERCHGTLALFLSFPLARRRRFMRAGLGLPFSLTRPGSSSFVQQQQ